MNRFLLLFWLVAGGFLHLASAGHLSSHLQFGAVMNGDQEVPKVTTDGRGVAVFTLGEDKTTLHFFARMSHLSGPVTAIHIHEGAFGVPGGVVFDLGPFLNGTSVKGVLTGLTGDEIARLLNGDYYINAHTALHPGGEIRGQIRLETDYRYSAILRGANEVPEVDSDGSGLAVFHMDHSRSSVSINVLFRNLSAPVVSAHIHNAPAGINGPIIFDFGPFISGNSIEAVWEPEPEYLDALLAGELYINIHTQNHPGGEIRGQIELMPGLTFDATFSGDQENPPVPGTGEGLGLVTVAPDLSEVAYYILFDGLTDEALAAHFHRGVEGVNGGVEIDLSGSINHTDNTISGTSPLTPDRLDALLRGAYYINIHTEAHPGGEIRGQVYRFAREGYVFELNGGQEVPPVTTAGTGAGYVSIDRDDSNLHYALLYDGIEGDFTVSHFHRARPGINGGVIFDIGSTFDAFGSAEGYWDGSSTPPFDAASLFRSGGVYVNVHSTLYPGGEIRGNIIRASGLYTALPFDPGFSDDLLVYAVLTGNEEVPPVTTDARGLATIFIEADKSRAKVNITATGLSGPITGVNIHEGDFGTNGPVRIPLVNKGNRVQMDIENIDVFNMSNLLNSTMYVNILTDAHPEGEIRGQATLDQDLAFVALLSGDQVVPAVTTNARGLATIYYTPGRVSIEINVQLANMSSSVTAVQLHRGALGQNGPVELNLDPIREGHVVRGRADITALTLLSLLTEGVYVNVLTEDHPEGEIRGQLIYFPGVTFDGWMSGFQENPVATTGASGLAVVSIFPALTDIALFMVTDGVSGPVNVAHLHRAKPRVNGGVVHDLSADINQNSIIHLGVIDDSILSSLLEGSIYINAHTSSYPGGELRGQLYRRARDGYAFDLCTDQEVGTINAPGATGSGMVSIGRDYGDPQGDVNVNIAVVTDGLTGPVAASHIHLGAQGMNGGIITDLTPFYEDGSMFVFGATTETALLDLIREGSTYVNVHTALHPGGEIRGQIVKDDLCPIISSVDPLGDIVSGIRLWPVPVTDMLNVHIELQEKQRLTFSIADISGKVIASDRQDLWQGDNLVTFTTSALPPGFYTLVVSDGRRAQAYKFIK